MSGLLITAMLLTRRMILEMQALVKVSYEGQNVSERETNKRPVANIRDIFAFLSIDRWSCQTQ